MSVAPSFGGGTAVPRPAMAAPGGVPPSLSRGLALARLPASHVGAVNGGRASGMTLGLPVALRIGGSVFAGPGPYITNLTPPTVDQLGPNAAISFSVQDDFQPLRLVEIVLKFSRYQDWLTPWDGTAFSPLFAGSARRIISLYRWDFTLQRKISWPLPPPPLQAQLTLKLNPINVAGAEGA